MISATVSGEDRLWWTHCAMRLGRGPVERAIGQLAEASHSAKKVRNRGALPPLAVEPSSVPAPQAIRLLPNPTRGPLAVSFSLPSPAGARIELLDVQGRRVLARDLGLLPAGNHRVGVLGGSRLRPGIYLVGLHVGEETHWGRAVVLR